jgi:putative membrane protein
MKKILFASKIILGTGILVCSLNSCKNEPKQEDPKEVAEDANDAKFETDSIEDDANYLVDVAEIDKTEIEIGKLAQQKGISQSVKDFGKMLVEDHTKSLEQVNVFAKKQNVTLPTTITDMGKDEYEKLNKKSGADFDKKFADMMVEGHKKAIDVMTKISEKDSNQEIELWASNELSVLTAHLVKAKELKKLVDRN